MVGLFKSGNNFLWIHRLLSFTFGKLIAVSNWVLVRKCKPYLFFVVGMLLFVHSPKALAQYIKIKGVVIDSVTNEPLPFVNVAFKDKTLAQPPTSTVNMCWKLNGVLLYCCFRAWAMSGSKYLYRTNPSRKSM